MTNPSPPTAQGFVHVLCNECGNDDVWLRCEKCERSDHFALTEHGAVCACGAKWIHATCLCGAAVPPAGRLAFVAFDDGPLALADLEVDWARVAILGTGLLAGGLAVAWWLLG